jgi:hypothetical protein
VRRNIKEIKKIVVEITKSLHDLLIFSKSLERKLYLMRLERKSKNLNPQNGIPGFHERHGFVSFDTFIVTPVRIMRHIVMYNILTIIFTSHYFPPMESFYKNNDSFSILKIRK